MDTAWTVVEILQWRRHCGTHLKRHRISNEDDSFNHAACQEKYRRLQRILDSSFSSPSPPPPHYQLSLLFSASDFLSSAPSSTSLISSFSSFGLFHSSCLCLSRFLFVCLQMTLSVCLCIIHAHRLRRFVPFLSYNQRLAMTSFSEWESIRSLLKTVLFRMTATHLANSARFTERQSGWLLYKRHLSPDGHFSAFAKQANRVV